MIKKILDIDLINKRINKEICYDIINKLKDEYLLNEYKKCKSVKKKIKKLDKILKKYNIDEQNKNLIINDFLIDLIPPGTKGIIKGNKFNNIVKNIINEMELDKKRFKICFEKQCKKYIVSEIPDWYIYEKSTKKIIIGMNQLDLWGDGHQLNREYKYLINNIFNTNKSKLLCVICNEIFFKNDKNKIFKLFKTGYTNNTLCYINNIKNIIIEFFD